MQTAAMHVMMDPEEVAALHAKTLADNERKERARIAAYNRAHGIAEPKAGDVLFVEPKGSLQRGRAGLLFLSGTKTEVRVVGEDDTVGAGQVNVHGAELIFADRNLVVNSRNATETEAAALRTKLADRDAELAKLREENARYVREARSRAQDDDNGGPARLRAASKARGELKSDPESFGGGK